MGGVATRGRRPSTPPERRTLAEAISTTHPEDAPRAALPQTQTQDTRHMAAAAAAAAATAGHLDLDACAAVAHEAARAAGEVILRAHRARLTTADEVQVQTKSTNADLVTQTDKAAEEEIVRRIRARFPEHLLVAEEGTEGSVVNAVDGEPVLDGDADGKPVWLIDPLDGTSNFVCGFPFFAVSIALWADGVPQIAVVLDVASGDMYTARRGQGAFCNDRRLRVSARATGLQNSTVVNNIGSGRDRAFVDKTTRRVHHLLLEERLQSFRSTGSAALNMAGVASGVFDAFFEDGFGGPWDIAAGQLLVEEAGGICVGLRGEMPCPLVHGKGQIVCGARAVVDALVKALQDADDAAEGTASADSESVCGLSAPAALIAAAAGGVLLTTLACSFFGKCRRP